MSTLHPDFKTSKKPLPPVAVVFISIALGFGFVLLYSFFAILFNIFRRKAIQKSKAQTDLELAETAEFLANEKNAKDDEEEGSDEEDRTQEDGVDVVETSAGDGSEGLSPSTQATLANLSSDGKDVQNRRSRGKKPIRSDSIQDGAGDGDVSGPLDDLKEEIDKQLAEIKEEQIPSTSRKG